MKNLYMIGGTMGIGKTTVSRWMNQMLPSSVMLDGDWCWAMDPFTVNEETKSMVLDNICHMLNNFLRCDALENIVFCWVMHEPSISDGILARLNLAEAECRVHKISLTCREDALCARLRSDIERGLRTPDVIPRSVARLPLYQSLDTFLLDVSDIAPEEAARQIIEKF